jgi:hypothetical protein
VGLASVGRTASPPFGSAYPRHSRGGNVRSSLQPPRDTSTPPTTATVRGGATNAT